MDTLDIMKKRHSVRNYTDKRIEGEVKEELEKYIKQCNSESGLHMQLCTDEPEAFNSLMAHYGKFKNARNYIVMAGKKSSSLPETCGYYGEKVVLKATEMGLNTCWVGGTYSKSKAQFTIDKDEKVVCIIAIGYGAIQGVERRTKSMEQLSRVEGEMPQWFKRGMEAAMLAPTALNQQKFLISLKGNKVKAKALTGFFTKLDLGIVKYHFEIGAGKEGWQWED